MANLTFELSRQRVFLIEDDAFAREQATTALEHIGVRHLHTFESAAHAVAALEAGNPCDVILSDWSMPGMDGLELLGLVKRRWPGAAFLLMTSNESTSQIRRAVAAGADGYLTKPYSLDALRETLQAALARKMKSGNAPRKTVSPELGVLLSQVQEALDFPASEGIHNDSGNRFFVRKLVGNLAHFVDSLPDANPDQLAVIRAYLACLAAVTSLEADKAIPLEVQNRIADGLALAAVMAGGEDA